MAATYSIKISWRGDGTFAVAGDDVLGLGRVKPDVTISYGRDQSRALSPIAAGSAAFRLNNISQDYSPENAASPLAGFLDPARPLVIGASSMTTNYTLFTGHTDEFQVNPDPNIKEVSATGLDALADFREMTTSTSLYSAIRTGAAINAILDSIGWPSTLRDIDAGATTMMWWCLDHDEVWQSITDVVYAEGVPALITMGIDGTIIFRDRHHRLIRSVSNTSQATISDAGTEPLYSAPVSYDQGWRDVYNVVVISVDERSPEPELSAIWSSDLTYSILSGSTYTITATSNDPFIGAITPVAGTDYQLRSGSALITLSQTAGKSLTISIAATGDTVIDTLQIRGYSVPVVRTVRIEEQQDTSIVRYGRKSYPDNAKLASLEDARALADITLSYRSERLPTFQFTIIGDRDARLDQGFGRNLSDRITIVNAELGMNRDFYIEQIDHVLPLGGLFPRTTFGCEATPPQADSPFTFDDATLGKFGTGKFGSAPLDVASTIFIFDHATQGKFGTGLFAT